MKDDRRQEEGARRTVARGIEKTSHVRGLAEVRRELDQLGRSGTGHRPHEPGETSGSPLTGAEGSQRARGLF
jgi:hypothetical protein